MNDLLNWFLVPIHNVHQASGMTETIMALGILFLSYAIILFIALCIGRAIFYMANCMGLKLQDGEAVILRKNHFIGDETRMQEMVEKGGSLPILMEGSYCPDAWSIEVKVGNAVKTWNLTHEQFNQVHEGQVIKAQYRSGRIKKCVDLKNLLF